MDQQITKSTTPTKVNKIIAYELPDFKGLKREFTSDVRDLREVCFDDCISSLIVIGQPWIAYQDRYFGGWLREYEEGEYPNIEIHDNISSLQLITDDLENPKITLYEDQSYGGASQSFTEETNLSHGRMGDKASSHIVERGAWILYEHENRQGWRVLARSGEKLVDYTSIRFHDRVSHVRPLKAGRPIVTSKAIWSKMKKENEICTMIDELSGMNKSNYDQEFSSTRCKEYESLNTYDFNFSNTTNIEVGIEVDVKLIAIASSKLSNSITVQKGNSETTIKRDRVELTLPAKIPPHTKLTVRVMRKECTIIVPVELTIEQNQKKKTEFGELRCKMGSTIYAEYESEKI